MSLFHRSDMYLCVSCLPLGSKGKLKQSEVFLVQAQKKKSLYLQHCFIMHISIVSTGLLMNVFQYVISPAREKKKKLVAEHSLAHGCLDVIGLQII